MKFKIRIFHDEKIELGKSATGKIDIRTGEKEFIIEQLRKNLDKARKIIIEVI